MRSWKQEPPKAPKEKATAELLQSLRSTPTLSPEALARIGRRVRANARQPTPRWVAALAGLKLPALAGALGSVAIVGGLTYVALERRPSVELPNADTVAIAPSGPLEIPETPPSVGAKPPPSVEVARARPEVLSKDARAVAEPPRSRPQPLPGPSAGGAFEGLVRSGSADRERAEGIGSMRGKASDSMGSLQGAPPPEPVLAARKVAASPVAQPTDSRRLTTPSANSAFAGAPPPAPAARSMAASEEATPAPMPGVRQPAAAAPQDDLALVDSAEQLAGTGRCANAIVPFSIVADNGRDDPLVERALFGRGKCRLTLGQRDAARQDLENYLARFPNGRFASQARSLLH